ncbi:hypothetical protein KW789_01380 [Candidatus Saccharibacteria bacterium]|nr:hypothetical protein [Candidatus Saccharibacteria bacterium]
MAPPARSSRLFPADELGIPLSIYIPAIYRDAEGRLDRSRYGVDRHHRFAPKKLLIHKQGEIGKVLRYSCLQMVPKELHARFNSRYDKPLLPETRAAKFGALLLSIARYLPAEAIDVSGDSAEERELTDIERQLIWANNELRPEQGSKVQREILQYVAKQDINGVDESLVEEFLTTPNNALRIERGKQLFRIAAEVAVEPVEQAYIDAWESKLLPRQDIRTEPVRLFDLTQARAVPKSPERFIMRHVVKDRYALERTLNLLQDSLSSRLAA